MILQHIAVFIRRAKAIPMFLKDKRAPLWKKALVVLGFIYLILPFDLIPPIIPVFGFLDDIVLWAFLISFLKDELDRYDVQAPASDPSVKYKDKNVVDVNYAVKEEDKTNEQH